MDTFEKTKKAGPKVTGLLLIGIGGVICTVPTLPKRIRLR
jgi:hypothetical protein